MPPKPLISLPTRRFSDAKSFEQGFRMLDDYLFQQVNQLAVKYSQAWQPRIAKSLNGMRIGTLISVNPNQTAAWADRAYNNNGSPWVIDANGVVVDVLPNDTIVWAQTAEIECKIGDGLDSTTKPVYLSTLGRVQRTKPTTGFVQVVGNVLNYDSSTELFTVGFQLPGYSYSI